MDEELYVVKLHSFKGKYQPKAPAILLSQEATLQTLKYSDCSSYKEGGRPLYFTSVAAPIQHSCLTLPTHTYTCQAQQVVSQRCQLRIVLPLLQTFPGLSLYSTTSAKHIASPNLP
ncbi:hypothetical protein J6590_067509 [Homalodisca vitripennis]|nr:hypothetical protein J6590_067509 [Homalodisca vitripennis]